MAMFSAWNSTLAVQSLISIFFIMSVATALGVVLSKTIVRLLREDSGPVLPIPILRRSSTSLWKKAA